MPGTTLATIQSYITARHTIIAYHDIPQCGHSAVLDLHKLANQLGPDYSIPDNHAAFLAALRCEKCGARGNMSITVKPPGK